MSSLILPAESLGGDSAGIPDFQEAFRRGFRFWNAYVDGRFDYPFSAIQDGWDAGLVWMMNYELAEDAYKGGYSLGRTYAINALRGAEEIGWRPGDSPIVFSATDVTVPPSDFPLADSFYRGTIDVLSPVGAASGAYGYQVYLRHLSFMDWLPPDFILWQWMNDGPTEEWADARQTGHGDPINGVSIDVDKVKKPFPMWAGIGPNPTREEEVTVYRHDSAGAVYEISMGFKAHCSEGYFFRVLEGTIAPNESGRVVSYQVLSDADLNAIPDYKPGSGTVGGVIDLDILAIPGTARGRIS